MWYKWKTSLKYFLYFFLYFWFKLGLVKMKKIFFFIFLKSRWNENDYFLWYFLIKLNYFVVQNMKQKFKNELKVYALIRKDMWIELTQLMLCCSGNSKVVFWRFLCSFDYFRRNLFILNSLYCFYSLLWGIH